MRAAEAASVAGVGAKMQALEVLRDYLAAVRRDERTWAVIIEKLIQFYLDLCIDLQLPDAARDGLHKYRNMAQEVRGERGPRPLGAQGGGSAPKPDRHRALSTAADSRRRCARSAHRTRWTA